ncbi:hypothetical protein B0O99DRAFT_48811 [Bisporella sp. PMI_857]|nr:hypothetical protein B0O99DRAFT_48811 [Bisporella sp. PMI_857]
MMRTITFADLPLEIQREIWICASKQEPEHEPRIFYFASDGQQNGAIPMKLCVFAKPSYPVPALLRTCREARIAALKEYTLWQSVPKAPHRWDGAWVYVHKRHDVLYIKGPLYNHHGLIRVIGNEQRIAPHMDQLKWTRHLAFEWTTFMALNSPDQDNPYKWMLNFPSLEEITIVIKEQIWSHIRFSKEGQPTDLLESARTETIYDVIRGDFEKFCKASCGRAIKHQIIDLWTNSGRSRTSALKRRFLERISPPQVKCERSPPSGSWMRFAA